MAKLKGINPLNSLYLAQFLSAFVDSGILIIILTILNKNNYAPFYLPLVQVMFFVGYIILSPWVGAFADKKPKSVVLIIGNVFKIFGVIALILNINPAISYAIVGIGAVIYSPAKYGILTFLTKNETELIRANAKLESFTIIAILTGTVGCGALSEISIILSLFVCLTLYVLSIIVNLFIPKDSGNPNLHSTNSILTFFTDLQILFKDRQSHFSLIGTGSFWMSSSLLRIIVFAWIPITLGIKSETKISIIFSITAIGIIAGTLITPYVISIKTYKKSLYFGLGLGICILTLIFINNLTMTIPILLLAGVLGGIYIVPMNTCLQDVGHRTIGAGKSVAIQNFVENIFNITGLSIYTLATSRFVPINISITTTGLILLLIVGYLFFFHRKTATMEI